MSFVRQNGAYKNAIVSVFNRKLVWEAGILPLNYSRLPLNQLFTLFPITYTRRL